LSPGPCYSSGGGVAPYRHTRDLKEHYPCHRPAGKQPTKDSGAENKEEPREGPRLRSNREASNRVDRSHSNPEDWITQGHPSAFIPNSKLILWQFDAGHRGSVRSGPGPKHPKKDSVFRMLTNERLFLEQGL